MKSKFTHDKDNAKITIFYHPDERDYVKKILENYLIFEYGEDMNQTRSEQVAKEIVSFTQNNRGDTQGCFDFAQEVIDLNFVEKDKQIGAVMAVNNFKDTLDKLRDDPVVEALWDAFEKMSRKNRLEWLLEFDCVFEQVKDWDKEFIISETERLKDKED